MEAKRVGFVGAKKTKSGLSTLLLILIILSCIAGGAIIITLVVLAIRKLNDRFLE
jgi:hypothetical protein